MYSWDDDDNPFLEHVKYTNSNCAWIEILRKYRGDLLRDETSNSMAVEDDRSIRKDFMKCLLVSTLINQGSKTA
jgi:hypothetical protein